MKKLILIIFTLSLILPCKSEIITGGVKYDYEIAREEVFSQPPKQIPFEFIRLYLTDKNRVENRESLNSGVTELSDRKIASFSDNSYGVEYFDDPEYEWFYDFGGRLMSFTKKDSLSYPCRTTRYKPDGSITNTGLKVSDKESFIFSPEGKLIAHWINNLCYDASNNVIMQRKYIK